MSIEFENNFAKLTGNSPFPWQTALYNKFVAGDFPESCEIPTGLGKTSVIAVWLLALANKPDVVPRRLVYVVNRRTVVDQTTTEVVKIRENLLKLDELAELKAKLVALSGAMAANVVGKDDGDALEVRFLAISTLRGQFADNREWSADPSRPAVVIGTVDMIGSRLLFSGYGAGFKTRPLYAGLLGHDALLVHDEAHLEPAFQWLVEKISESQRTESKRLGSKFHLRVMEMSATPRHVDQTHTLGDGDLQADKVIKRITANKQLQLSEIPESQKLADKIVEFAAERFGTSGRAIIIFVRRVEDAEKIVKRLPRHQTAQLTGTMRGRERDKLADEDEVFARFVPNTRCKQKEGTVYLVCTSAGEVGVNLSADHMICDLATFDSIAQRLGRLNRFGLWHDSEVHVFYSSIEETEDGERLKRTLALLKELKGDASPRALSRLDATARRQAFAVQPVLLPVTDMLFDSWTLTTIRKQLAIRPPIERHLHGVRDADLPETRVAWREEVGQITGALLEQYRPQDLLDDYPLKPQELLRDLSGRVFKHLSEIASRHPTASFWLLDEEGEVRATLDGETPLMLGTLVEMLGREFIENKTVLLPPDVGGLNELGTLDGDIQTPVDDVADEIGKGKAQRRLRVWNLNQSPKEMRLVRRIDLPPVESGESNDADQDWRTWYWFETPYGGDSDGSKSGVAAVLWDTHTNDVVKHATRFARHVGLPEELQRAIVIAAKFHDLGKRRVIWQRSIGRPVEKDKTWFAKSAKHWAQRELTPYRHEFGSLVELEDNAEIAALPADMRELVLHLIAAHHGFGRPHFPTDNAIDPEYPSPKAEAVAAQVPLRFARLQQKYGRWGLAYLESILRAADYEASANPSKEEVM